MRRLSGRRSAVAPYDQSPVVEIELARQQWQDGSRRIERARSDPALYARLHSQVDVVIAELRRRIGQNVHARRARRHLSRRRRLGAIRARRSGAGRLDAARGLDGRRRGVLCLRTRRIGLRAVSRPPARPRRRDRKWWVLLSLLAAGVVFFVGVGFGEALHDNPKPGGEQTILRTLTPVALLPAPATTVTVTTSRP